MPLKLKLRPLEKVLVSGCIVQNITNGNAQLLLLNTAVVMRQKDVIKIENARTVAQKLYWAISEYHLWLAHSLYPAQSQCAVSSVPDNW